MINPTLGERVEIYDLARELEKRGHKIYIVQPTKEKKDVTKKGMIEIYHLKCFFLPRIRYTIPPLIKEFRLLKKLSKEVDLFQAASYFYLTCWPPILMKFFLKRPVILVIDALYGISWNYGSKFTDLVGKIYTQTIGRILFLLSDQIITLHQKIVKDTKRLSFGKKKILIIPNGISENFLPNESQVKKLRQKLSIGDSSVILFVGRLVRVKRIEFLLTVFKMVSNEYKKVKLLIIGDGPAVYEREYKRLARDLGSSVMFLGRVAHQDLPNYLDLANIVVLTSRSEGLPRILIEAGQCRKPIVSSNIGGVEDIVDNGRTGFLVSKDDLKGHVEPLVNILKDPELGRQIGELAFDKISRHFRWPKITQAYENLYKEIKSKTNYSSGN